MSYAPTNWAPPPVPNGYWNAEEQHEFTTVLGALERWIEKNGTDQDWLDFDAEAVTGWRRVKTSPDEVFEIRFASGMAWSVTGSWCCCGWSLSEAARIAS